MKFTEITTDKGTYRLTKMIEYGQEINSAAWCYNYCMAIGPNAETRRKNLAKNLIEMALKVSDKSTRNTEWYKNRQILLKLKLRKDDER